MMRNVTLCDVMTRDIMTSDVMTRDVMTYNAMALTRVVQRLWVFNQKTLLFVADDWIIGRFIIFFAMAMTSTFGDRQWRDDDKRADDESR